MSTPLPWERTPSARPSCSKPCPTWPWTLPGRGQPQLLWVTWARASPSSEWVLLLQLDFLCAPHGLSHLPFSYFLFYLYLSIYTWLLACRGQRSVVQTWLVWLSLTCPCGLSMLCGHIARNQPWWEGEPSFLACPHTEPLSNSLWEASLWNFSAFCLSYRTFGCLSKQGCLPIAFQVIPWAHIPLWLWTTWVWLQSMDTTFSTTGVSQSHRVFEVPRGLSRFSGQLPHFSFVSQNNQIAMFWEIIIGTTLVHFLSNFVPNNAVIIFFFLTYCYQPCSPLQLASVLLLMPLWGLFFLASLCCWLP